MDMSDNPLSIPFGVLPDIQNRAGFMFVSLTVPPSHPDATETRLALRSVGYCELKVEPGAPLTVCS